MNKVAHKMITIEINNMIVPHYWESLIIKGEAGMKKLSLFLIVQLSILSPLFGELNRAILEQTTENNLRELQELLSATKEQMEKVGFSVKETAPDKDLIALNKATETLIQFLHQREWAREFIKKAVFDEKPVEKFILLSYLFLIAIFGVITPFVFLLLLALSLWVLFIVIRFLFRKMRG